MEPEWSLWVHDIYTGDPIQRVDWAEGSDAPFTASIAGDGQSSILVSVAEGWEPGQIADLFTPNARLLARWWGVNGGAHPDDVVVTAHKVEDFDYPLDDSTVTVAAVDLLGETDWRMVGGADSDKHLTLTIEGRSPEGAVRAVFARMMQWGPEWVYPIDLPPDGAGGIGGVWPFWKGHSLAEILKEIRDQSGVDIYLRPYATATGGVRFQTLVGAPVRLGSVHVNLTADQTNLAGLRYRVNGSKQITGLVGLGNGTGEDQETRWAGGGPFPIPIRDTKKSFGDMVGDPLQDATQKHLDANRFPIGQWDIGSVVIGADFPPDLALPGRVFELEIYDDPVIPDGVHTLRVLTVTGGNGREMKPAVQYA